MKTIKYIMLCALALFGALGTPPAAAERSDAEFVEIVKDSVVRILFKVEYTVKVKKTGGEFKFINLTGGSGFLISSDGVVMTNKHVALRNEKLGEEDVRELEFDPDKVDVEQKVLSGWSLFTFKNQDNIELHCYKIALDEITRDSVRDVATFTISNKEFELPAPLCFCQKEPRQGDSVVAIGFPGIIDIAKGEKLAELYDLCETWHNEYIQKNGDEPDYITINEALLQNRVPKLSSQDCKDLLDFSHTVTFGKVINTQDRYSENYGKVVLHSASIYEGNSGGPLVDRKTGFVVGINTFKEVVVDQAVSTNCALSHVECRKHLKKKRISIFEGDPYRYLDTMNAMRHLLGFSTNRNPESAFETLQKTANNKDADAHSQFLLGMSYLLGNSQDGLISLNYGFGCDKDVDAGMDYLSRAAERGKPDAQFILGIAYLCKDDQGAHLLGKAWLMRAAAQNYPPAKEILEELRKKEQ